MAADALHKEKNAMWSQVILAGFEKVLLHHSFSNQIKMIMMSSPCFCTQNSPFLAFLTKALPTDRLTDRPTNGPTDTPSDRDARRPTKPS